ncbi:MAG: hypothetical protein IMZ70_01320 [Candidatus Atribacteria bacterium]|nr:hypothetical protein [Candidatus Atribacteria bacterium]MBE3145002.1 hypothetical protein [Planctomycetota bacterium]
MERRTFLKAVFAAAVVPASVVECLYRPEKKGLSEKDLRDMIKTTLSDMPTDWRDGFTDWKNYACSFKGIPLEFKPNLSETDDEIYVADEPK